MIDRILRVSTVSFAVSLTVAFAEVSFSGPEVLKLDWTTRSMGAVDINGNGLTDLALINQDTAQIDILHQRLPGDDGSGAKTKLSRNRWEPFLEDARFDREGVPVGFPVFDLAMGDLNGDGLIDMAYTAREVPLTIRYQSESGQWANVREFDDFEALGWTGTIKIQDLDGDGRSELVVLAADAIRVIAHDDEGQLVEAKRFYITGANPYNLMLEDVNADGLVDILYITSTGKQALSYREQIEDRAFGPERRFVFERPVRTVQVMPHADDERVEFCSVDSRSGSLEFFHLKHQPAGDETRLYDIQPEIYPIFKKGRSSASYAMGDLKGDGHADLLIANPASAEVVLFPKVADQYLPPKRFPSFSSISSMVTGRFYEGAADRVVMLSVEEKAIGLSYLGDENRLLFPKSLQIDMGNPVVCEAIDMDDDGYEELALIHETKGKYSLLLARPVDRASEEAAWEVLVELELSGVKRKPTAMKAMDVFGSDRSGLMIFVPREAPLLFAAKHDSIESLSEIASDSTVRQNLLKDIQPAQVSAFDTNADGLNELVVGRKGYARALQVQDDSLDMVDQFNARRGEDVLSAVIPLYQAGVVDRLLFYVSAAGELQWLQRHEDGVFRYQHTAKVGQIDLLGWSHVAESVDEGNFTFWGDSQFWYMPGDSDRWTRVIDGTYETELEGVHYTHVQVADFNDDNVFEIIAVDGQKHVVEILSNAEDGWNSLMYWEIFEQNMHYKGRTGSKLEPRQTVIADFTGDGRLDFAFLIHDRVLLYPQE